MIKKIYLFCTAALLGLCLYACDSETTTGQALTPEENQKTEELIMEEPVVEVATQDEDGKTTWETFKAAIYSKDEEKLKQHCSDNIHDYEGLFFMLNELYVRKAMDEMSQSDLEMVEENGVTYLKFYAEDIEIDEDGYEYGSAVTLYFIQTESGLILDKYSAAG